MPLTMNWHYALLLNVAWKASSFFQAGAPILTESALQRLLSRVVYQRCMGFESS